MGRSDSLGTLPLVSEGASERDEAEAEVEDAVDSCGAFVIVLEPAADVLDADDEPEGAEDAEDSEDSDDCVADADFVLD